MDAALHKIVDDKVVRLSDKEKAAWLKAGKPIKRDGLVQDGGIYLIVTDEEAAQWKAEADAAAENPPPPEKSDVEILKEKVAALEEKQARDELLKDDFASKGKA